MIRLIITLLVITTLLSGCLQAQQYGYKIVMDTDYDEVPTLFKLNDDGSFVGLVKKAPPTDSVYVYNSYLYKIDPQGDTMSIKYAKNDTVFTYYTIDRLTTGTKGFLLTGWGYKTGGNPNYPFTIMSRIDDNFDLVWEKTFMFSNYYYAAFKASILELVNGEILYACSPHLNSNMFIMKLSSQGDSLDFASYSGIEAGEVWGLSYSPDSLKIWLSTKWAHYVSGGYVCSAISINNNLEQVEIKYYPEHFHPPLNTLCYSSNLLLTGGRDQTVNSSHEFDYRIGAFLMDTVFNIVHEVHLTNPDTTSRAAEVQGIDYYYPNCIYLGGTHNLQGLIGQQPSWFYITKLNDTLGVEYEKYIGGDNYYWLFSVTAAADGGVLLAGTQQEVALTYFQRDGIIIKLDSIGCVTDMPNNINITISDVVVYPNPGDEIINIRTALLGCMFNLFDINGRQIFKKPMSNRITTVNVNTLQMGTYYYSVTNKNNIIISGTWIKK